MHRVRMLQLHPAERIPATRSERPAGCHACHVSSRGPLRRLVGSELCAAELNRGGVSGGAEGEGSPSCLPPRSVASEGAVDGSE